MQEKKKKREKEKKRHGEKEDGGKGRIQESACSTHNKANEFLALLSKFRKPK